MMAQFTVAYESLGQGKFTHHGFVIMDVHTLSVSGVLSGQGSG